jgi:hypothetical protein
MPMQTGAAPEISSRKPACQARAALLCLLLP